MHEKKVGGKSQTTWIRSGMNGGLHEERLCESEINFDPAGPLSSSWTTSSSGHALGVFEFRNLTDLSLNSDVPHVQFESVLGLNKFQNMADLQVL